MYAGYFMTWVTTWKFIGSQPLQSSFILSTAETCLWHGIRSFVSKLNFAKCWEPARQTLAPESGNIVISTWGMLCCWGRHNDNITGISLGADGGTVVGWSGQEVMSAVSYPGNFWSQYTGLGTKKIEQYSTQSFFLKNS